MCICIEEHFSISVDKKKASFNSNSTATMVPHFNRFSFSFCFCVPLDVCADKKDFSIKILWMVHNQNHIENVTKFYSQSNKELNTYAWILFFLNLTAHILILSAPATLERPALCQMVAAQLRLLSMSFDLLPVEKPEGLLVRWSLEKRVD